MNMTVTVIPIKDKSLVKFVVERDNAIIGRRSACEDSIKDPAVSGSHT